MATQTHRISPKAIVKYLNNFITISTEDITNPNGEVITDIFWNLLCHVYSEAELLKGMRGAMFKKMILVVYLRQISDKILPNLNPPFTATDLIFPTKERTAMFLNAFMGFLKTHDAQSDIRVELNAQKLKLDEEQERIQQQIQETVNKNYKLRAKEVDTRSHINQFKDQNLTLRTVFEEKSVEMAAQQAKLEAVKRELLGRKKNEAELSTAIQKIQERIEDLRINTLPPKAEFEEKLTNLGQEVRTLENELKQKRARHGEICGDIKTMERFIASAQAAHATLEESLELKDKNKATFEESELAIQSIEKTRRDVQTETVICERDIANHKEAYEAEKASVEVRKNDILQGIQQLQVVEEDVSIRMEQLKLEKAQLQEVKAAIVDQSEDMDAKWNKILANEQIGWNRIKELRESLQL